MKKENKLKYILPENRTVRIVLAVFFWLLAAACAGCIFWLSSKDGNQSQNMSDSVRGILMKLLGPLLNSFIVRKFAHFFEYAVLGFLIGCALFLSRRRFSPITAVICSALYSVSDEIHQYFVPGRACRIFDVGVDTLGALTGTLILALIILIMNSIAIRRKEKYSA
ncbi:MAG: VanZ family protein [Oscillospiraceae bacterium]|nr:VanZ family protein [Oscillospiraceae bacterium]